MLLVFVLVPICCAILGAALPGMLNRITKHHSDDVHEDILIHGRPASPGVPGVAPLGDRMTNLETGQVALKLIADEHTTALAKQGDDISYIVKELSANGGDSFRDHVEASANAAALAAADAKAAATTATAAAVASAAEIQKFIEAVPCVECKNFESKPGRGSGA